VMQEEVNNNNNNNNNNDVGIMKDLDSGNDIRVSGVRGRSYTIFIEDDLDSIEDFEVVLRGVCREYNARVFERTLNNLE
jgi:hypothetical protein